MKKLILSLLIMITFSVGKAQNAIITKDGNYVSVIGNKGAAIAATGKTFTDTEKGIIYPIYMVMEGKSRGKLFITKISKKTNKPYRSFLKLVK